MKIFKYVVLIVLTFSGPLFANVIVSSPGNGETVGSTARYAATANTSTCSKGVASMGVYVNNELIYVENGTSLNTTISLKPGSYDTVVEEWDYCGGATFTHVPITVAGKPGIWVTSPADGSTVNWLTNFIATATTSCAQGVAAMGIYVNNQLEYISYGAKLNTQMNLAAGTQHAIVEEWDNCGASSYVPVNVTVKGSGNTLYNLQASKGWNSWGELAPVYDICPNGCPGVTGSMKQGIASPSLSRHATQFNLAGTKPYSDILWSNPVLGQFSTQGLSDNNHKLLPTLHNFTYDAYFYMTNPAVTQVLEFDISMYMDGTGMIWGTQCRIAGGNEWDIWDNVNAKWVPTSVGCNPVKNGWNHVTIQAQRGPNNTVLFQSITLNGVTANLNKSYPPFSVPADWWGVTVNYQMDGNYKQSANTTYLDNFSLMYW